jgi:hypothetical protein
VDEENNGKINTKGKEAPKIRCRKSKKKSKRRRGKNKKRWIRR